MRENAVWKIEDEEILSRGFGVLKYVEGRNYESNNCFFVKNCVRSDTTHEYVMEGKKIAEVKTYVEKYSSENFKDVYEIVNRMMEDPENKYNLVQGHFIPNKKYYQMDFIKYSDGSEVRKAFVWRTRESIVMIVIEAEDMNENLLDSFTRLLNKYSEKHPSILPENSPAPARKSTGGPGGGHSGSNPSSSNHSSSGSSGNRFPIKECSPLVFTRWFNRTMNGNQACQEIGKHCLIAENKGMIYKMPSGEPNFVSSTYAGCEKEFGRWLDETAQMNRNNQSTGFIIGPAEIHVICCLPN